MAKRLDAPGGGWQQVECPMCGDKNAYEGVKGLVCPGCDRALRKDESNTFRALFRGAP